MTGANGDHLAVVEALTEAVTRLGWRLNLTEESTEWRISIVVLPPLAVPRPERNRWPDEPEESEEPSQGEREREWAPDWDVNPNPPLLNITRGGESDGAQ